MGTKEHAQVVADYLRHVGCDSVDGIFLGIGGIGAGASKAGVRSALKKIEAHGRRTGDWPKRDASGNLIPRVVFDWNDGYGSRNEVHFPGIETLYSLRQWSQAW
jgi:hypothetical protein